MTVGRHAARCPGCGREVAITVSRTSLLACPACATLFEVLPQGIPRPIVVVAHADEGFLAAASVRLDEGGFEAVLAGTGETARAAVAEHRPAALVLDVAIPGALAHAWLPELRADPSTADLRVVLVAAAHDAKAFRRAPRSLHGADDLIEAHGLDRLVPKLQTLLAGGPGRRNA